MRLSSFALLGLLPMALPAQTRGSPLFEPDTTACPAAPGAQAPAAPVRTRGDSAAAVDSSPAGQTVRSGSRPVSSNPAVIIRASATARSIRFNAQPRIRVRLCGGVLDSIRVVERSNLPDPVVPGTVYRDVRVAVEILGRLHADCILRRLGVAQDAEAGDQCGSLIVRSDSVPASAPRRTPNE